MKIEVRSRYPGWISGDAPRLDFSNIVRALCDRVTRAEDTIAVALGRADGPPTETLTYADLNARAQDLARALVASGVTPGDRVGIATRRDFDVLGGGCTVFRSDRRILQMPPVPFDAATFEICGALLNGGTCVIADFIEERINAAQGAT